MYNNFLNNIYNGVSGITLIDSGVIGKNIGIFAITHGNEPVGLDIFNYLCNEFKISEKILKGKIFLISINIKAYEMYIADKDIMKHRFIHHNMNRITNTGFINGSYEYERFLQLQNIFSQIDTVLDIHSVPVGNDIIGITDYQYLETAKKFFDVDTLLVDDVGKTGALSGYFLRNNKEAYGLECGNHIDLEGLKNGIQNTLNFLSYFGYISYNISKNNHLSGVYEFFQEIKPLSLKFKFKKQYKNFQKLYIGERFAQDGDVILENNYGNNIHIWTYGNKFQLGDGVGFLLKNNMS